MMDAREHPVAFTITVTNRTTGLPAVLQVLDVPQGGSKLNPRYEVMAPDGYVLRGLGLHSQLEHAKVEIQGAVRLGELDLERCDGADAEARGCTCADYWSDLRAETGCA